MGRFAPQENWGKGGHFSQGFTGQKVIHEELFSAVLRRQKGRSFLNTDAFPAFLHHEPAERELKERGIKAVDQVSYLVAVNRAEHALFHYVRYTDLWGNEGDRDSFIGLSCDFSEIESDIYEELICSRKIREQVKDEILRRRRVYLKC